MRKLGHWHIYNWYRVLIGPGEGRRCVRMITAFRIVLKKCFVFQCSGSRPIFAWEKRKSGLEDAKMNISVGALALNAHNEHFWQFFVFRRSIIEAASVLGGISKFGYVHFINDIAFHHTNCNCHWIYVRLGPISSINRVKTEFSPLFPQLKYNAREMSCLQLICLLTTATFFERKQNLIWLSLLTVKTSNRHIERCATFRAIGVQEVSFVSMIFSDFCYFSKTFCLAW